MAGRPVGGWRDTDVHLVLHVSQVAGVIEALALAEVHVSSCMGMAPASVAKRREEIKRATETLGLALGATLSERPNAAKWRELLPDHVREYAVALWRGRRGEVD